MASVKAKPFSSTEPKHKTTIPPASTNSSRQSPEVFIAIYVSALKYLRQGQRLSMVEGACSFEYFFEKLSRPTLAFGACIISLSNEMLR